MNAFFHKNFCRLAALLAFLTSSMIGHGQTVLTISGDVTRPLTLQATDLKAMPHTDVTVRDRDGKDHRYTGIPLAELLKQAGAPVGNELRGKNLIKCLVVKAADGYEVLFALPELDPLFTSRTIILADAVDGVPLEANAGPYRVVVPGEQKPARWIRQVKAMEIRTAH